MMVSLGYLLICRALSQLVSIGPLVQTLKGSAMQIISQPPSYKETGSLYCVCIPSLVQNAMYQGAEVECCALVNDHTPVYYKVIDLHVYDNFVHHHQKC